jgi:hypothetical protein
MIAAPGGTSKGKPSHALLVCQLLCVQCFGTLWEFYLPLVGRPYTLVVCAHPLVGSAIDSERLFFHGVRTFLAQKSHLDERSMSTSFFGDVISAARETFLREHWNRAPFLGSLVDHDQLVDAFCEGDVHQLLGECRKNDNSAFSAEEIEDMERGLDAHGRTLNLPYCFCRGACDLYNAAVDAFGDLSNDIEVGVYVSKAGGDVAEWHCDANHNFTLQLTGAKEWTVLQSSDGARHADASRGMFDPPRNRAEQLQPPPQLADPRRYCLQPGSVLYLPPGEWHRVVPVAGGSLSVDVRIGHLTAAKWISEAMHAAINYAAVGPPPLGNGTGACPKPSLSASLPLGPLDDLASSGAFDWSAAIQAVQCVRVPRPFPCEAALSDGLNRAATLTFLKSQRFLAPSGALHAETIVCVAPMVALTVKQTNERVLFLSLLAVSSLSSLEYCRFSIECQMELHDALVQLTATGEHTVKELSALCTKPAQLLLLLRCLLHANVLYAKPHSRGRDATAVVMPPLGSRDTAGLALQPGLSASKEVGSSKRQKR